MPLESGSLIFLAGGGGCRELTLKNLGWVYKKVMSLLLSSQMLFLENYLLRTLRSLTSCMPFPVDRARAIVVILVSERHRQVQRELIAGIEKNFAEELREGGLDEEALAGI